FPSLPPLRPLERFLAIQAPRVADGEEDDHGCHSCNTDHTSEIEETIVRVQHTWPAQHRQVPNREKNPQLRRPETPKREPEFSHCVGHKIRLNREQKKSHQQTKSYVRVHEP